MRRSSTWPVPVYSVSKDNPQLGVIEVPSQLTMSLFLSFVPLPKVPDELVPVFGPVFSPGFRPEFCPESCPGFDGVWLCMRAVI